MREEMSKHQINGEMLKRMNPFIDKLLYLGIIIGILGFVFAISVGDQLTTFAIIDLVAAGLFMLVYLARKQLRTSHKLLFIIAVLFFYGLYMFDQSGIFGTGTFLMLTAVILASIFLGVRFGIAVVTVCSVYGLYTLYKVANHQMLHSDYINADDNYFISYVLVYIGVVIATITLFIGVTALKKHLYDNIIALNKQMIKMEQKNDELVDKSKEIEYLAYYNKLTTLPNIVYFRKKVDERIALGNEGVFTLIDCKGFHKFNAFYGMDKGDELLHFLGKYTSEKLGDRYTVGYLGNNSIALWSEHALTTETFRESFSKHRDQLKKVLPFDYDLDAYAIGVMKNDTMENFDDMYDIAYKAMKLAKRGLEKSLLFIDEAQYQDLSRQEELEDFIDEAIKSNCFQIYYQEKIDSRTGKVVGIEALSRLKRHGIFLSPKTFIPIIEEKKWCNRFGSITFENVFRELPRLIEKYGESIEVSINVSPAQLSSPSFIQFLRCIFNSNHVNPKNIELEITENILLMDMKRSIGILNDVKAIGCRIAIDDFGTGFSSMKYISELPIDVIKIDKSFVDKVIDCKKTRAIVKSIIDIAEAINVSTVAEGVEYEEQAQVLRDLNCHVVQGYLYSKPQPLDKESWKGNKDESFDKSIHEV